MKNESSLTEELRSAFNRNNIDSFLETPDFMLAELVVEYLKQIKHLNTRRAKWHQSGVLKQLSVKVPLD